MLDIIMVEVLWLSSVPPGKNQGSIDKQQLLPSKCQDSVDLATAVAFQMSGQC